MDIGKANDLESVCTINLHNLSLIVHEMHSYAVKKRNERKKNNTSVILECFLLPGREDGIRTRGLILPKHAR